MTIWYKQSFIYMLRLQRILYFTPFKLMICYVHLWVMPIIIVAYWNDVLCQKEDASQLVSNYNPKIRTQIVGKSEAQWLKNSGRPQSDFFDQNSKSKIHIIIINKPTQNQRGTLGSTRGSCMPVLKTLVMSSMIAWLRL